VDTSAPWFLPAVHPISQMQSTNHQAEDEIVTGNPTSNCHDTGDSLGTAFQQRQALLQQICVAAPIVLAMQYDEWQ
jgi:hypothetical protein